MKDDDADATHERLLAAVERGEPGAADQLDAFHEERSSIWASLATRLTDVPDVGTAVAWPEDSDEARRQRLNAVPMSYLVNSKTGEMVEAYTRRIPAPPDVS